MRRERLLDSCLGLCKRDRGVQVNRRNVQESEQMITSEGQIMSSGKGRMILLFNSTILQRDCHFVEEFFNFERRTENNQRKLSHRAAEKQTDFKGCRRQIKEIRREQDNCTTRDKYFVALYPFTHQDFFFCVSHSCFTIISERFS